MRRLRRRDLPSDTLQLARALIGVVLVRRLAGAALLTGRIVETEAYEPGDPSSHAFRGMTQRNRAMFGRRLHAYVYLIYGTAYCLNVSSEAEGVGAAVLIRAAQPLSGIGVMRERRGAGVRERDLARGPGRLCAALDIDRALDGADLERDQRLWLARDGAPLPDVGESVRIGLAKAAERQHRFYARGSSFLSGPRALSP
ncbi:MAG: DNA-3-methyladenine glycosylase [Candidatus Velthaea sp.]